MMCNKKHWITTISILCFGVCMANGQGNSLDSLLQMLKVESSDSTKARLMAEIGDGYYEVNFDSAVYYYKEAIALSKEIPYFAIQFSSWRSLGYVYSYRKNDYEASLEFFRKAVELSASQPDSVAMADALSDIGRIYWLQGKPYEALEYHLEVKSIGEKMASPKVILRAITSLGILENENGNNQQAKEYYQQALQIADSLGRDRNKGIILNNWGKACQDDKEYDKALEYFLQAETIFMTLKDNDWLNLIHYNKGKNFTLQGNLDEGINYLNLASQLNEKTGNKEREVMIQTALAAAYQKRNNPIQAIAVAEKALSLLKEVDTKQYYDELYKILGECYKSTGDGNRALQNFEKYIDFKEKNNEVEEAKKIASLRHLYDSQKKEKKILELKTANLEKERSLEASKNKLNLILIAFLSLLSLLLLAFYQYKLSVLKKIDQIKNNIAKDLHDNVGASLNHIKMLSVRMKKEDVSSQEKENIITRIKTTSDELMYNMHDMVWTLDEQKETIADLLERMQDHADVFLSDFNIPYKFNIAVQNKNLWLDAGKKINIYLVFKESINNILKHTEAERVVISFSDEKMRHFKMSISSFYSTKKEAEILSNQKGVCNMKMRAKHMGGKLSVIDKPGNFIVELSI